MKKFLILVFTALFLFSVNAYADEAEESEPQDQPPEIKVSTVGVIGNPNIASEYILNVVDTKPGLVLNREMVQTDIESIYNLGFFSYVDVDIRRDTDGAAVIFSVQENPKIESINFTGNTIFTTEQLMSEVFSQVGTVFNRVFFRNDLDRIQEHYHKDGYVMVRVSDVQIFTLQFLSLVSAM